MAFRIWNSLGAQWHTHPQSAATGEQTYEYVEAQLHQEYPSGVSELNGGTSSPRESKKSSETDFEYDYLRIFCHILVLIFNCLKA
jgi:hypothetical protein